MYGVFWMTPPHSPAATEASPSVSRTARVSYSSPAAAALSVQSMPPTMVASANGRAIGSRASARVVTVTRKPARPDFLNVLKPLYGYPQSTLERARAHSGHLVTIEIEVDTLTQLREVLDTGLANVVLLDNMDIATLMEAVKIAQGRVVLEASGGVTPESIAKIAATGVDYVSSGALTHSAPNFDVALDIEV